MPVPLPNVGGLESHYFEILNFFVKNDVNPIVLSSKFCGSQSEKENFDKEMARRGIIIERIPKVAPYLFSQRTSTSACLRLIIDIALFWIVSAIFLVKVLKKYRPESCLMRHSMLLFTFPFLLRLNKLDVIGDGDLISTGGLHFFFRYRSLSDYSASSFKLANILVWWLEKRMLTFYTYFRTASPFLQRELVSKRVMPLNKVIMVPPAVDCSSVPKFEKCPSDIAYFGLLERFEGVDILIKAFAAIRDYYPNIHLYIFGYGPIFTELFQLVESLDLTESVTMLGKVPRERLYSSFNQFSILVFPRIRGYGHIPMKILESLAAGKVIISTKISGIYDVFDGKEIVFVEPNSVNSLAECLRNVIHYECLRQNLSKNALARSREFDSHIIYRKILRLLVERKMCTRARILRKEKK